MLWFKYTVNANFVNNNGTIVHIHNIFLTTVSLNKVRAIQRPGAWFLKIDSVWDTGMCVHVCVCVSPVYDINN